MASTIGTHTRGIRSAISWAALACGLAASSTAWAQQDAQPSIATSTPNQSSEQTPVTTSPSAGGTAQSQGTSVSEIVVTGTHIQGGVVTGPVVEITHNDIENGGFSSVSQAIQSLPSNFAGGVNPLLSGTAINIDNSGSNPGYASSANLRGLGSNATLTLLDGHRLTTGGEGISVDLSLIPLSAVDRVEVLADGASATYGSDAIAGVVNIITRHDFDGFETRVRYSTPDGGKPEDQISQLAGFSWSGGNLELAYQYDYIGNISTQARPLTRDVSTPNYLFPAENQHSFFLDFTQDITPSLSTYAEAIGSLRQDHQINNNYPVPAVDIITQNVNNLGYTLVGGLRGHLPAGWTLDASGTYSHSQVQEGLAFNTSGSPAESNNYFNDVTTGEVRAQGPLLMLPGGETKGALDIGCRHEAYETIQSGAPNADIARGVWFAAGEVDVPIIGPGNGIPDLRSVTLTFAGRYENYSDFGNTLNPKVGFELEPATGYRLHGDYSTSFRAPQGFEESTVFNGTAVNLATDPASATGSTEVLYRFGGNPDLRPETATNFTFGFDLLDKPFPGFHASVDYYHIDYKNRIVTPDPEDLGLFNLSSATVQGLITRDPTSEQVNAVLSEPGRLINLTAGAINPSSIGAIIDARDQNLASSRTSGFDFALGYRWHNELGRWELSSSSAYILDYDEKLSGAAPTLELANTIYYPAQFRMRNGVTWSLSGWSAAGYVNYVNGYVDNRNSLAPVEVGSWTTVDLHFSYHFADVFSVHGLGGTTLTVDVSNLLNQQPPGVAPNSYGYAYDPTNGSIIGRLVSVELTKRW